MRVKRLLAQCAAHARTRWYRDLSLGPTGAGTAGVDGVEVFGLSGTGADTLVLARQWRRPPA